MLSVIMLNVVAPWQGFSVLVHFIFETAAEKRKKTL
jgi:hypothetical protein